MNHLFEATYLDGITSTAQKIIVDVRELSNELHMQLDHNKWLIWQFKDIEYIAYDNGVEIRNKKYSEAILKIDHNDFNNKFYKIFKSHIASNIHAQSQNRSIIKLMTIIVLLLGFIALVYFFIIPPLAEKSVSLLPQSFDDKMGNVFMETFLNNHEIDTQKTLLLEKFASKLSLSNNKTLHFSVIKSNDINAFAIPNGHIVVFSAILDSMKGYGELVALLGHEASHINNRHSTKMLCRNLTNYILLSLIFGDINGVMAVLVDNAQQLHTLSYSRKFENEADEQGLKILINHHVHPNGMINLFERLESQNKTHIPAIISTHPLTTERKKNIKKWIAQSRYITQTHDSLASIFSRFKE